MIRLIGYLAFVVSLMACAKIVPPDGGDRDLSTRHNYWLLIRPMKA